MTTEERQTCDTIRQLYHPDTLVALDVTPLPTIIQHLWFLIALLDNEEVRRLELDQRLAALETDMRKADNRGLGGFLKTETMHWADRIAALLKEHPHR